MTTLREAKAYIQSNEEEAKADYIQNAKDI